MDELQMRKLTQKELIKISTKLSMYFEMIKDGIIEDDSINNLIFKGAIVHYFNAILSDSDKLSKDIHQYLLSTIETLKKE